VALARTAGCPARIDQVSGQPAFLHADKWVEIKSSEPAATEKATLELFYQTVAGINKPIYFTHFSLGRFDGHRYQTLNFEGDPSLASFPAELQLEAGQYRLITGNRQADGSVLGHLIHFQLQPGEKKKVNLILREKLTPPLDGRETDGQSSNNQRQKIKSLTDLGSLVGQNNFILLLIAPDQEPTKHLMDELQAFMLFILRVAWPLFTGCGQGLSCRLVLRQTSILVYPLTQLLYMI